MPPTEHEHPQTCGYNPFQATSPGRTLLPGPIASLVTTFTQTASIGLRVGTKVGGFAIAGARETTLTSLELTRAAVEAILTRAGRDVSERRNDELGRTEAESMLERSVGGLNLCSIYQHQLKIPPDLIFTLHHLLDLLLRVIRLLLIHCRPHLGVGSVGPRPVYT